MELQRISAAPAAPQEGPNVGRMALGMGLSIGAGIAAERIQRSLIQRGSVPAIAAGLAGGAVIKALGEGGVEVVNNLRHDRDWSSNVGERMVDGLRTGTLDAGLGMAARPIARTIAARFPQMGAVRLAATSGLVIGAAGGAAGSATDRRTWQHGVANGLVSVGVATGVSGAFGGVLGAAGGAVAGRIQARQAAAAERAAAGIMGNTMESTTANARTVGRILVNRGANLAELRRTNPAVRDFIREIRQGDIILIAKGNYARGTGETAWGTNNPYTHAGLVTKAPGARGGGRIVEATTGGTEEFNLVESLSDWMPHGGRPRTAFTIIRPTEDAAVAAAAVRHAQGRIGQPYDFAMNGKGDYCSGLVYNAFARNPEIPTNPLRIRQVSTEGAPIEHLRGIGRNGALWRMSERKDMGIYKNAPFAQRMRMYVQDGAGVAAGAVEYGAAQARAAVTRTVQAVTGNVRQVRTPAHPEFLSPGDLNLADGRKIHTLVVDGRPSQRLSSLEKLSRRISTGVANAVGSITGND